MKNIVDYITVVINVKNGYYIKIKALCNGYSMENGTWNGPTWHYEHIYDLFELALLNWLYKN